MSRSVGEVLRSRAEGERDPSEVLGLAVDGGGMRGIISASMLLALQDLGLLDVFDRYYGCSAGALNLAVVLNGGGWSDLSLYYDQLAKGFVRRPRLRTSVLDMAYLQETLFADRTLDVGALKELRYVLTDVRAHRLLLVQADGTVDQLRRGLLAGAWLPYLAGKPPELETGPACDGYVLEPLTLRTAVRDGCTHVLALTPVVPDLTEHRVARTATAAALDVLSLGLGRAYLDVRRQVAVEQAALTVNGEAQLGGARVLWLSPDAETHGIAPITTNQRKLLAGVRAGYGVVWDQQL